MQRATNDLPGSWLAETRGLRRSMRIVQWLSFACIFLLTPATAHMQINSQTMSNPSPRPTGTLLPAVNRLPDANDQMEMRDQKAKQQNFVAANAERKKQIADDSAKLLKLANDLKAEIDKTSKDTLSLNVIRKADEIERLAHSVKEKMKLTVGGS
jgi:hypothetical protein